MFPKIVNFVKMTLFAKKNLVAEKSRVFPVRIMSFHKNWKRCDLIRSLNGATLKSVSLSAKRSVFTLVGLAHGVVTEKLRFKFRKIPSRPGGGHGKPFHDCLRRLGVPPRPPLSEMPVEDRRATVTDALQSTTFRLYSSAAAPVTGAAAP